MRGLMVDISADLKPSAEYLSDGVIVKVIGGLWWRVMERAGTSGCVWRHVMTSMAAKPVLIDRSVSCKLDSRICFLESVAVKAGKATGSLGGERGNTTNGMVRLSKGTSGNVKGVY
jgi:hypothetical protein